MSAVTLSGAVVYLGASRVLRINEVTAVLRLVTSRLRVEPGVELTRPSSRDPVRTAAGGERRT